MNQFHNVLASLVSAAGILGGFLNANPAIAAEIPRVASRDIVIDRAVTANSAVGLVTTICARQGLACVILLSKARLEEPRSARSRPSVDLPSKIAFRDALAQVEAAFPDFRCFVQHGAVFLVDSKVNDQMNPLTKPVGPVSFKGSVDELIDQLAAGALNMGPPMYFFSSDRNREVVRRAVKLDLPSQTTFGEILATISLESGIRFRIAVVPAAAAISVDSATKEITAREMIRLELFVSDTPVPRHFVE